MKAATTKELRNSGFLREREDLERLCDAIGALGRVILDMQYRKTDFVIQDRLSDRLGDCIEYFVNDALDPIRSEAQNRIDELKS